MSVFSLVPIRGTYFICILGLQVAVTSYGSSHVTLAEFMESDLLESHQIHHHINIKTEEEEEQKLGGGVAVVLEKANMGQLDTVAVVLITRTELLPPPPLP